MGIKITLDTAAIARLEKEIKDAAELTMGELKTDIINSATMPFDVGNMQNGGTYTSGLSVQGNTIEDFSSNEDIHFVLTNDAPQARRLYYHPEYNFQQGRNANAGAGWLEPYVNGDKKDFVQNTYEKLLKQKAGV